MVLGAQQIAHRSSIFRVLPLVHGGGLGPAGPRARPEEAPRITSRTRPGLMEYLGRALLLFVVVPNSGVPNLDPLDRAIAVALQVNGRASWRAIARCLDTPERTVTRRGQAMLDTGVVKVSTYLDTTRVGRARPLIVAVHTEPGRSVEIGHQIAKRRDASSVSVLEGTGQLVCMLLPSDGAARYQLLLSELPSLRGVRDTSVSTVLRYFRAGYDWSGGRATRKGGGAAGQPSEL